MEGWEKELEGLLDDTTEGFAAKLGISNEAADHVHDAIADHLDSVDEEEPEEEKEGD